MKSFTALILALLMVILCASPVRAQSLPKASQGIPKVPGASHSVHLGVTKSPTAETVIEGGYAEFVARATYYTDIIWYLRSPEGDVFAIQNYDTLSTGLRLTGLGTERLGLNYIPAALDGWSVYAKFVRPAGDIWSAGAMIHVLKAHIAPPVILNDPQSVSMDSEEAVLLSVDAASPAAGTELHYQWYQNSIPSTSGSTAIPEAVDSSYIPEIIPGTMYYYCTIQSAFHEQTSSPISTRCAAVTYPTPGSEIPEQIAEAEASTEPESEPIAPAEVTAQAPEAVTEPAVETISEPAEEASTATTPEAIPESSEEPVSETLSESIEEPAAETIPETIEEPLAEPETQPVTEPMTEAASEPETQPMAEPVSQPSAEPALTDQLLDYARTHILLCIIVSAIIGFSVAAIIATTVILRFFPTGFSRKRAGSQPDTGAESLSEEFLPDPNVPPVPTSEAIQRSLSKLSSRSKDKCK